MKTKIFLTVILLAGCSPAEPASVSPDASIMV